MPQDNGNRPEMIKQVMISSTFTDLKEHRQILIGIIKGNGFSDTAMENDSAKPNYDIIESSLNMVRKSHAYIAVISMKYGQVPEDNNRNPEALSITEMEFREAVRLKRPILLFIMSDEHPVKAKDVETDPVKMGKLNAFRKFAKKMGPDTTVHRVYNTFTGTDDFTKNAGISISELRSFLDNQKKGEFKKESRKKAPLPKKKEKDGIPHPPQLYAEPPYIGSHPFVGRKEQIETINEWATSSDTHSMLLFEAIGGSGKSILTWEWTTKFATDIRSDWAGVFWYSFYEKGAVMADFCRRALAYINREPVDKMQKKKTVDMVDDLIHCLTTKPWLIVLDGLERVLVSYHRIDAAQIPDEEAGMHDVIINRDPCSAIRPEDDELLRKLAAVGPSKVLVSSRLVPRVLLNTSNQPISGVKRIPLEGLKPPDAEEMIRSCGVTGNTTSIQDYLKANCDCHPLVIGALAGLINNYFPDRGNFDAWVNDPDGGAKLNMANLNLVQRRNHILHAALDSLSEKSKQLLSTLSLLAGGINFETLRFFNPYLSKQPDEIEEPEDPQKRYYWKDFPPEEQSKGRIRYKEQKDKYEHYKSEYMGWLKLKDSYQLQQPLTDTIIDLEKRGLIQYDSQAKHYDLHPVVRGIALGRLNDEEKEDYGQLVIDYFSKQPHNPYDDAKTLEELAPAIQIMQTYLQLKEYSEAFEIYLDLRTTLLHNLEEYDLILKLLKPFCNNGLTSTGTILDEDRSSMILNQISVALSEQNHREEALKCFINCLKSDISRKDNSSIPIATRNVFIILFSFRLYSRCEQICTKVLQMGLIMDSKQDVFMSKYYLFGCLSIQGKWEDADKIWAEIDVMGREWSKNVYRQGEAEVNYIKHLFRQNKLEKSIIDDAIRICQQFNNRRYLRSLFGIKGEWLIEKENYEAAIHPLQSAIQMAH